MECKASASETVYFCGCKHSRDKPCATAAIGSPEGPGRPNRAPPTAALGRSGALAFADMNKP